MGEEDRSYKKGRRKKSRSDAANSNKWVSGSEADGSFKARQHSKYETDSAPRKSVIRKQIDPETTKYFSEILNLFESKEVDMEERAVICGNALEETRGKEFELATDYIISHTLQSLLENCDVNHLCAFLQSCINDFPLIAMDRSGSHVAETAIRSLAKHLQDMEVYSLVEDTVTMICRVIIENLVDVMCNCYGSHVLRSLLSLCKGVALDSSEFHATKSSTVLAERLNFKASRSDRDASSHIHQGFPDLLKFLVSGMLNSTKKDIKTLRVDQYSSLVFQIALKFLVGYDEELLQMISILLGCNKEDFAEGNSIKSNVVQNIVRLVKETAFSHLMEVILEVAPEVLYNELLKKVFRSSLFELSSHHCGNFVVQALISHARDQEQMELMWEELGTKFKDILEMGRPGVIASLIAASQRLKTHEQKCCQALAAAVCSGDESPTCVVPRILFLDSYFSCEDKANWNWPRGVKIHVIGSLILQEVFRYHSRYIQPFITSIASMEADNILEAAKDTGGARVIESFLSSDATAKMKRRLIAKLRGHFAELSMHLSGSFTVEKCFTTSNMSLQEAIVAELLEVRSELSKTKQGPHLIRKLDVYGFAARPDQWRSRQASKLSAYNEFCATFGSGENKTSKNSGFLSDTSEKVSRPETIKQMRKEIADGLASSTPFLSKTAFKRKPKEAKERGKKYAKTSADDDVSERKKENQRKRIKMA
ncbi:pumilio homolog 23 [Ziziphus jujuba]|uniref:Pumilio homolog 23 n=1 Tax=Ziziphus jujuba TaxID=326968 RepID=A0A6P4AR94_ZIZJJ|nr:pumilio homolog 23 [Ziziphus jujuba]XP_024932094.3 pumilio homolog 23 [Ziziphus jujuba]